MKKTLLLAVLLLLITTTGMFAATTDNFTVTTVVGNTDLMTVSTTLFNGTTVASFEGLTAFTTLGITKGGAPANFDAWLSTLSNNRAGYKVAMKATAMTSSISGQTDAYINYTVSCGGASLTTNNGTEVTATGKVVSFPSLSQVTSTSNKIALSVNQNDFDKAVSGSYTGKVTFIYTAN